MRPGMTLTRQLIFPAALNLAAPTATYHEVARGYP
jgi:hypothetical protein